jgi:AraC-like DNA-binding protein/mannose-6-phosphate isomerase-like protein (cupin superfamily)
MQSLSPCYSIPHHNFSQDLSPSICLTECNFCVHDSEWMRELHLHEDLHELYLINRGSIRTHVEEQVFLGKAGDLMHHPRGRAHSPVKVGREELEILHIRWRGGDGLVAGWRGNPVHDRDGRIRYLMEYLHSLRREGAGANAQRLRALLVEGILREGLRLQAQAAPPLERRVSRFVRQNLQAELDVKTLAAAVHMSKHHFARKFRAECGKTPMRFVTEIRLETARRLLLTTDLTIADIAERVGLRSAAQFSHTFKRHCRITPGSLRN